MPDNTPADPALDAAIDAIMEPIIPEIKERFIAGLAVGVDTLTSYSVYRVLERYDEAGERVRVGGPDVVIPHMDQEQLDHLHMQLGAVATRAVEAEKDGK